jgi:hypothetical protein
MDMTDAIAPKSDQMNSDDLMTGPRTFTIKEVRHGSADQPVEVVLAEFPADRPFKPSKTASRLMVAAWGKDSDAYIGQRMTLYRDPEVSFGRDKVGGIRISHMSGLKKTLTVALTTSRAKRSPYVVKPLLVDFPEQPPFRTDEQAKKLGALIREQGLEKAAALDYFSRLIGRDIDSTAQLTKDEADKVIDALQAPSGHSETVEPEGWGEVSGHE